MYMYKKKKVITHFSITFPFDDFQFHKREFSGKMLIFLGHHSMTLESI